MKDYIEERAIEVANFIITESATVRETAKKFGISKSTVHTVLSIGVMSKASLTSMNKPIMLRFSALEHIYFFQRFVGITKH